MQKPSLNLVIKPDSLKYLVAHHYRTQFSLFLFSDTYFRKTGLERSASISKDLEWFKQRGIDIPQPSSPGIIYATYLTELAEKSAPSFLCHLYNIYFAHISGGQAIGKQVP